MARLRLGPYKLPDDTPEKMQEILGIVNKFRGGDQRGAAVQVGGASSIAAAAVPSPSLHGEQQQHQEEERHQE